MGNLRILRRPDTQCNSVNGGPVGRKWAAEGSGSAEFEAASFSRICRSKDPPAERHTRQAPSSMGFLEVVAITRKSFAARTLTKRGLCAMGQSAPAGAGRICQLHIFRAILMSSRRIAHPTRRCHRLVLLSAAAPRSYPVRSGKATRSR
jgi:hypothetical protein